MTQKPDNPPAFPCIDNAGPSGQTVWRHDGMTLRDYFAAKAMQALMIAPEKHTVCNADQCANVAYLTADAMLKAREATHD